MSSTPNPPSWIDAHECVRFIGKGSYGEVWLARTVLGTYRAVKIVSRSRFESDKPFEREFQGIQNYEPISRSHPGLVDVLHVARDTTGSATFYYIMEVADDAETGIRINHETYKPRTLSSEIARRGRFSLAECSKIGGALADALAHLHAKGRVHRDIKPSNIIFVEGVPKLADVGLVANIGERASYLGTAGYIDLEAPGTAAADIFSLGKVLYQMATGNSVDEFPQLPTGVDDLVVPDVLRLNPIFLKACDPNPLERYQSASKMRDALALVAGGEPSGPKAWPSPGDKPSTRVPNGTGPSFPTGFRVAILYQANAQPDGELGDFLKRELATCKCEVFVESNLRVGVDWARTIEAEIRRANAVIVLLSPESVTSEMLVWEVEMAHQSRLQAGRPAILPVRVQYGPKEKFSGVLGPILEPLQCFKWTGQADDERMLSELVRALEVPDEEPGKGASSQFDPGYGAVPLDCKYYVVRPTDRDFQAAIARHDSIVLVRGARQMGKTSLLARGLNQARKSGTNVVWTDFQKFNSTQLESIDLFLQALGDFLAVQLDIKVLPVDVWDRRRGANTNFENYLRREVFPKISGHLVWALDEVDRLFTCSFGGEVFGLIRSWHNERAGDPASPWSRVTLAMAYATESHLFITDVNQSPFNVGTRLTLEDFTLEQVADLNQRYGSPLKNDTELRRLFDLLGGQPYLVRRAFNELTAGIVSFDEFVASAALDDGLFGDHLRRILVSLTRDPELTEIVRGLLQGKPCLCATTFYRLRSAGVLKGDSPTQWQFRCELYAEYLGTHLK